MNKPEIFRHEMFGELPIIVVEGMEWFGATEAARALSFAKPHDAVTNHVDDDDSVIHGVTDSLGRIQKKKFINESGLYSIIFGAAKQGNNPEIKEMARKFKRWVTSEVLPTIRKTGGYVQRGRAEEFVNAWLPYLDDTSKHAVASALEQNKKLMSENNTLKVTIEEQKPKVVYSDAVQVSKDAVLVKDLAATLRQKGIDIGEKRLFEWLREHGYLCKKKGDLWNMPTQKSLDLGVFVVKHGLRTGSGGEMRKTRTPKVTGKGQIYFVNKFLEAYELVEV